MYSTKLFKTIKPNTPSQRQLKRLNKKLNKKPLLKNKIIGKKKITGRNNSGKITIFHKGGGVKKKYRLINFKRTYESTGIICSIEHDPNRNAFIASVFDNRSENFYYIILPKHLKVGDMVMSGVKNVEPKIGNSLLVANIPEGTPIHNISIKKNKKSQISRAAGTSSMIRNKYNKFATIELSSGKLISVPFYCFATVGVVSNHLHWLTRNSKAGHSRWLNKRPTVRGVAMNPIDHPHGGGEGKTSGKKLTPWGKPLKKIKKSKKYKNIKLKI